MRAVKCICVNFGLFFFQFFSFEMIIRIEVNFRAKETATATKKSILVLIYWHMDLRKRLCLISRFGHKKDKRFVFIYKFLLIPFHSLSGQSSPFRFDGVKFLLFYFIVQCDGTEGKRRRDRENWFFFDTFDRRFYYANCNV